MSKLEYILVKFLFSKYSSVLHFSNLYRRQYVLDYRQKDIFHSWPFPEKYLQMCLNHGISNDSVLPPFEPHHLAVESLGFRHSNCSQQNEIINAISTQRIHQETAGEENVSKEECCLTKTDEAVSKICGEVQDRRASLSNNTSEHDENDHHLGSDVTSSIIVSKDQPSADIPTSLPHVRPGDMIAKSNKRLRLKRRRHKGKHKKKTIVNILSMAKPCTYEDRLRLNGLYCGLSTSPELMDVEQIEEANDVEKSELTEECLNNKLQTDDCEGDINTVGEKRLVMKFKFCGCSPNSCNMDQDETEKGLPNA